MFCRRSNHATSFLSSRWFCLLLLLAPVLAVAQTSLSTANAALTALQQEQEALLSEQKAVQQQIAETRQQIVAMEQQESPEQAGLDQAAQELATAQAAFQANPSEEAKAVVSNAEFRLALAERKYRKANEALFTLKDQLNELTDRSERNATSLNQLAARITAQQQAISALSSDQLRQERALRQQRERELATVREQLAAANQEIARLQDELIAATTAPPELELEPEPAPPAATPAAAAAPVAPATTEPGMLQLSREQLAVEEARLAALLQTPDPRRGALDKIVNLRNADGSGKSQSIFLKPLGYEQYRGDHNLSPGEFVFSVGSDSWQQAISANGRYEFILDLSDSNQPRLLYFPASLAGSR